jgi:hypothetical protein
VEHPAPLCGNSGDSILNSCHFLVDGCNPRSLKIEIQKESEKVKTEQAIAFSPHSTRQVLLRVMTLKAMMASKIVAFLDRREIRDAFDMEFLVKKGIFPDGAPETLREILRRIDLLTPRDYSVKLGSLLEAETRSFYRQKNFAILKAALQRFLERLEIETYSDADIARWDAEDRLDDAERTAILQRFNK